MRFYLDYTVCATPYLALDTYLHGITVPCGRLKHARPSAQSDNLNYERWLRSRSEIYVRFRIDNDTLKLQDIDSLFSGIMDNNKTYNQRLELQSIGKMSPLRND